MFRSSNEIDANRYTQKNETFRCHGSRYASLTMPAVLGIRDCTPEHGYLSLLLIKLK